MQPFDVPPVPENTSARTLRKLARVMAVAGAALVLAIVALFGVWSAFALISCDDPNGCFGDIVESDALFGLMALCSVALIVGTVVVVLLLIAHSIRFTEAPLGVVNESLESDPNAYKAV